MKIKPKMLITDGSGDAYCPRCKAWLSEYHVSTHSIDEREQKYCHECGQRLIWDIDWSKA